MPFGWAEERFWLKRAGGVAFLCLPCRGGRRLLQGLDSRVLIQIRDLNKEGLGGEILELGTQVSK